MADVDPNALIPATLAAKYANVSLAAVCNWVARGHLAPAKRPDGYPHKDQAGRPLYRLLDVAKAERATAKAARRIIP